MQKTLLALSLIAGIGLIGGTAGAVPMSAAGVKDVATPTSPVQQVQFAERRTRHGVVKCYRDFVVGPYRCHHFRNGEVNPFSF